MNNRNLIIAIIVFFTALNLNEQVTFRPGIQAGINISKFTDSDLGNKTDFYIGGFGALKLSKFYTLQPELTYSRQGAKGNISMGSTSTYDQVSNSYNTIDEYGNVDASLQYISGITINKINFTESLYVLAGPFFDILIADDVKVDPKNNEGNFNKGDDIDLGIIGGLGYSLKNGISFEGRVKKGFTNSFTNYYADSNDTGNLVFQFGATYTFGKK
ncbi:MAG: outer membrane beta-barrel protein [Flavobacterium sp.]